MASNAPSSSKSAEKKPAEDSSKAAAGDNTRDSDMNTDKKDATARLGALEEDDEFEEFAADDWNETEEDAEAHLWEDNWDDDDVEDDFSKQLRAELEKTQQQPQPMTI